MHEPESQIGPPPPTARERPLSDEEIRDLRKIIEADRRMKWLLATTRITAIWVAAAAGTVSLLWDNLVRLVLHLAGR
ncbi:MAG: hypothetical protein ACTHWH_06025 [Marinobacter sp.]